MRHLESYLPGDAPQKRQYLQLQKGGSALWLQRASTFSIYLKGATGTQAHRRKTTMYRKRTGPQWKCQWWMCRKSWASIQGRSC